MKLRGSTHLFFTLCSSLCGLLTGSIVRAQSVKDSSIQLSTVLVSAGRPDAFQTGNKVWTPDSLLMQHFSGHNLSALLGASSSFFIKSYGPGGIALSSIRGTSASHSTVLWGGFSLQNNMLGQSDLSLIPVDFADDLSVQHGGSSAYYGSGLIGGSIRIGGHLGFSEAGENIYSANLLMGSFGLFSQGASLLIKRRTYASRIRIFRQQCENNFSYRNLAEAGSPRKIQQHAALTQRGLMWEQEFKSGKYEKIALRYWAQQLERELPPLMTQDSFLATQHDLSHRLSLEWQHLQGKMNWQVRSAYFYDELFYDDPPAAQHSRSFGHSWLNEAELRYSLGHGMQANAGLNISRYSAANGSYLGNPLQWRKAFFGGFRLDRKKISLHASVRKEWINSQEVPFTFSTGAQLKLSRVFKLKTNGSRNYRYPSFNDLYWVPGGNPSLQPEQGWSTELGLLAYTPIKRWILEQEISAYSNWVNNWILWLPQGGIVWSPVNAARVWARGLEYAASGTCKWKGSQLLAKCTYTYVRSSNEEVRVANDASLHKQLIYVPQHSASASIAFSRRDFSIQYTHTYTGLRYIYTDNSAWLDPFQSGNIFINYVYAFTHARVNLGMAVKNLWQEEYQVLPWRPMPGRSFEFSLKILYHHKQKQNT